MNIRQHGGIQLCNIIAQTREGILSGAQIKDMSTFVTLTKMPDHFLYIRLPVDTRLWFMQVIAGTLTQTLYTNCRLQL